LFVSLQRIRKAKGTVYTLGLLETRVQPHLCIHVYVCVYDQMGEEVEKHVWVELSGERQRTLGNEGFTE
jgi:hypothetical protein